MCLVASGIFQFERVLKYQQDNFFKFGIQITLNSSITEHKKHVNLNAFGLHYTKKWTQPQKREFHKCSFFVCLIVNVVVKGILIIQHLQLK